MSDFDSVYDEPYQDVYANQFEEANQTEEHFDQEIEQDFAHAAPSEHESAAARTANDDETKMAEEFERNDMANFEGDMKLDDGFDQAIDDY